jgi:sugar/nucleoside kinase (ribokinase family)
VGAGGQAANVAAWVAGLGGSARFVGKHAGDAAGLLARGELEGRGVDLRGPEVASGTGTVVSIATPDGRRTMLSDRGVSPDLHAEELDASWFAGCELLHLPAYSVLAPPIRESAHASAALVPRISLDLSSTATIRAAGVDALREQIARLRLEVVFANEDEAALVGEIEAETVVVKRGARGCVVRSGGEEHEYDALPAEVVDSTGAGDAFAAGFLLGGPELALEAAARCVGRMGAMP